VAAGGSGRREPPPPLAQELALKKLPDFEESVFTASLRDYKGKPGGDLQLTFDVPMAEKYKALSITDTPGIMLLIHAKRLRRGS
jgi:hypothetical protein